MGSIMDEMAYQPTIYSVWIGVEKYWDEIQTGNLSVKPETFMKPLDALLTDVFLGYSLKKTIVHDFTSNQTAGILSVIGLNSNQVIRVTTHFPDTINSPFTPQTLEGFINKVQLNSKWYRNSDQDRPGPIPNQSIQIILKTVDHLEFPQSFQPVLQNDPSAIFLIFGLGKIGQCIALEKLILMVDELDGLDLVLAQDLGIGFLDSGLGIIYRKDNADAALILDRIRMNYTTNFEMEDMLLLSQNHWEKNRDNQSKSRTISSHITRSNPLSKMIMKIKRMVAGNN